MTARRLPSRAEATRAAALLAATLLSACGGGAGGGSPSPAPAPQPVLLNLDFTTGAGGWVGGQADYSPATAPEAVITESRPLPSPFTGTGLQLAGTNRSDDLLLFAVSQQLGFAPNTAYAVSFQVKFITGAPTGCVGVGGSPGESVWIKAGVLATQPQVAFNGVDYRLNVDWGQQGADRGMQGLTLGTVAGTHTECAVTLWQSKTLGRTTTVTATADAGGRLWVVVGMDSGFEARSSIFLQSLQLNAMPL